MEITRITPEQRDELLEGFCALTERFALVAEQNLVSEIVELELEDKTVFLLERGVSRHFCSDFTEISRDDFIQDSWEIYVCDELAPLRTFTIENPIDDSLWADYMTLK